MKSSFVLPFIAGFFVFTEAQRSWGTLRPSRQRLANQRQEGCTTPDGNFGTCTNIKQCQPLLALLRSSKNNPEAVQFLRRSVCDFLNGETRVCCFIPPREQFPDVINRTTAAIETNYNNFIQPPQCGTSLDPVKPRIVGGRPADLGSWPWMVALGYRNRRNVNAKLQWMCGAALVTRTHVVTAAHCTKHPTLLLIAARIGDLDIDDKVSDGASPVTIRIRRALAHPEYNAAKYQNDIAILYLNEPVQMTNLIQPICLPKNAPFVNLDFVKKEVFVAGWGSISFKGPSKSWLQEIQLPVVDNRDCQSAYAKLGAEITQKQICAAHKFKKVDACQGDSGGPLMYYDSNLSSFYLIGVVSYGHRCAEPGFPGIYTRTTAYLDWINKNLV